MAGDWVLESSSSSPPATSAGTQLGLTCGVDFWENALLVDDVLTLTQVHINHLEHM